MGDWVAPDGEPGDIVDGPDPGVGVVVGTEIVFRLRCGGCTFELFSENEDDPQMLDHRAIAHSARRNPKITCQAAPPWDHERWCIRPTGHEHRDELGHWTPSFNGGRWWRAR